MKIPRRVTLVTLLTTASLLTVAAAAAGSASSAAPRKWYWTESRAEALVVAKVRIPYCRIWVDDSQCPDGTMRSISLTLIQSDCRGASEYKTTFTYNRFTCEVVVSHHYAEGRIAVYVTGRSTFRWKILGVD